MWPAHRRVCGPGKCNPFQYPVLTREEAKEAMKHCRDHFRLHDLDGYSLVDVFTRLPGVMPAQVPALIKSISEDADPSSPDQVDEECRQDMLCLVHRQEGKRLDSLAPNKHRSPPSDWRQPGGPFCEASTLEDAFQDRINPPYKRREPLPAMFYHLLLVMPALLQEFQRTKSMEVARHAQGAQQRLLNWVDQELVKEQPERARLISDQIRMIMGNAAAMRR
ncbi:hypothetical protein JCM10213v2_003628 [Rhodosporidiobolus nylandii]